MAGNFSIDDLTKKTGKLGIVERDESYYGLQGLDPNTVLYIVCADPTRTPTRILCVKQSQVPQMQNDQLISTSTVAAAKLHDLSQQQLHLTSP
jgi:hypothetical protein